MDGLECSEIRMSDVCDTTTLRFDSDYYKKEYLEIEQFICKNRDKFVTIESQGLQVDASAFYPSLEPYYNTGTIPFVRVADVKDQIEYNACVNIPEMGEEFRTLHMCYPGDVVLTKGYRLRNALFHEIIDPLNDEWQVIFKNSYHVLKQVVDQNIWRLKQLKLLPSASQAAAEEDYNREPPPDIDWPTDEEAKFTWFYYEMLKLNKDGARVLLKGKIDFAEHHYETECTVRWNESLSETAIKNASITSVVDSQEKELAAAI